jgi:poly-gamma-glutamate synthesis protein (capsule biosynthesis protein)
MVRFMQRRTFLHMLGLGATSFGMGGLADRGVDKITYRDDKTEDETITLFLCGDVMTGRGIDQILPYPSHPVIYESYLKSARDYVRIAEQQSGPIPRQVSYDYVWGDAMIEFRQLAPDIRIINLETAITTSESYWPLKGINYRMHPQNTPCLSTANIDACVLANNHVLDWGYEGLTETLSTLKNYGIGSVGAGQDRTQAEAPLVFNIPSRCRILLYAFGHHSSGVPSPWRADIKQPGVALLGSLSSLEITRLAGDIAARKQQGDLIILSIHWGSNWGYEIPSEQRRFAHWLIDKVGVNIVHGHSSHHPKGIEFYHGAPIFYGCGDFLNDYEGIGRYDDFRDDLTLAYFVTLNLRTGRVSRILMTPLQIKKFRLQYPTKQDQKWLQQTMARECSYLKTDISELTDGRFELAVGGTV